MSVSQTHEAESDKSQNHVHSSNGERSAAEGDNMVVDMFRWSRCKKPLPQKVMRTIGIPLPAEHVEVTLIYVCDHLFIYIMNPYWHQVLDSIN